MSTSFHNFPNLPPELRLEIWREHFASCHGTQIHIFHSTPLGPRYANQDATTGGPGYDTLGAARVSAEAASVFRELFHVGDTRCLQPQSGLRDAGGRLIDHRHRYDRDNGNNDKDENESEGGNESNALRALYANAAREELRRHAVEFALGPDDVVYVVDAAVTPMLASLCEAPWFGHVRRLALQILNFPASAATASATATATPTATPPRVSHRLDRWAKWDELLMEPPAGMERVMTGAALEQVMLVVVPTTSTSTSTPASPPRSPPRSPDRRGGVAARPLRPNIYGFVVVDCNAFVLGSADENHIVGTHGRLIYARICEAFPNLEADAKIGFVADAVPARARFSIYP